MKLFKKQVKKKQINGESVLKQSSEYVHMG